MEIPRTTRKQIVYVVVPHPDDEVGAWALLEDRPDDYLVLILCTHGEATGMTDGRGHQPELGEWTPPPQPWAGPRTETARRQRLASWHAFLDAMANVDSTLDRDLVRVGTFQDGPSPFELWVGESSARVVFDGGDGTLTPEFVTAALQRVRALRATHLPLEREHEVIGASYWNASYAGVPYTHPDHRAVHVALWSTDQGVPGPQWCRTASADPDVELTGGGTVQITPGTYDAIMAVDPATRQRTGRAQVFYGWLAPPDGWDIGEDDATAIWSRRQSFWCRFA